MVVIKSCGQRTMGMLLGLGLVLGELGFALGSQERLKTSAGISEESREPLPVAQTLQDDGAGSSPLLLVVACTADPLLSEITGIPADRWEESLGASLGALPTVRAVSSAGILLDQLREKEAPFDTVGGAAPAAEEPKALDAPPETIPLTERENALLRWAAPRNYDYLLTGMVTVEPASGKGTNGREGASPPRAGTAASTLRVHVQIRDVISLRLIKSLEWTAPLPQERELYQTFWLPLVDAVASLEATDYVTNLTIRGLPGTVVRGFTKKPVVIPAEGNLTVVLPKLHTFRWRSQRAGYEDLSGFWTTVAEREELVLSPLPLLRDTLEWGSLRGQFGDFWLGRYFFQNRLHIKGGLEQYLVGLYLPSVWEPDDTTMSISLPLLLPGLVGEWFFGENNHFIRPYLSLGLLLRCNLDLASLDPLAPFLVAGRGGFLWQASRQWAFFGELGFDFYPFAEGNLLAASEGGNESGPRTFLYGDRWYLDLFVFRVGVRITYEHTRKNTDE
ncbi:MAG: hypothetical protein N2Z76_01735 [Treponemataceae bacterium]|nr:hypothetical protein [Treponemataceae bacterium]